MRRTCERWSGKTIRRCWNFGGTENYGTSFMCFFETTASVARMSRGCSEARWDWGRADEK